MKRLGILLPSSGTVQEVDFYRRAPAGVSVHSARMRLTCATVDGRSAGGPSMRASAPTSGG